MKRLQDYNSGTRGHMPPLAQRYDLEKNTTATAHRDYKNPSSGQRLPYSLTTVRPVGTKATNMEFFSGILWKTNFSSRKNNGIT